MSGHVLVVERDNRIRDAICMFLGRAGIQSYSVASNRSAWVHLTLRPDLVLVDLAIPNEDGMELLREMKEINLPMKVAVIAPDHQTYSLQEIASLHPDAIFGSPLDFDDFSAWLVEQFAESQPGADAEDNKISRDAHHHTIDLRDLNYSLPERVRVPSAVFNRPKLENLAKREHPLVG